MFGSNFELKGETLEVIEEIGSYFPGGFFIYKAEDDEELLYANKAVFDIFGCDGLEDFKELTGYTFKGMVYEEDYRTISDSIVSQIKKDKNELDYVEYRIVRKDGEIRWVDDYGHFVRSKVYGGLYYVFISDTTEKHLRAESDKATRTAVIDALGRVYSALWFVNDIEEESFVLFRTNESVEESGSFITEAALKILKFSDAIKNYINTVVAEEDRERLLAAVNIETVLSQVSGKKLYSVGYRRIFESEVRFFRLEFAKVEVPGGKSGIVAGFRDVDDEVRKEQEIKLALQDAIDAANASNKAKSDFLSSMSHDIRTPMNGIMGMSAIAAAHLDDKEKVKDCLKKINDSSEHLLSLINDVLDMNKIESGKIDLKEEDFNLSELIDNLINMTRSEMNKHKHTFTVNILSVEHEEVLGDPNRLQQVFLNILSNAIKYTPDGGRISLKINERKTKATGVGHFEFTFEDNGYGMTEEFLEHIFEPFMRAEDKTTASIQGTGLGMAITRNIVRMMGGDISVESVYGEGSKFTVDIFLKIRKITKVEHDYFTDLRVLVADDDPLNCESACETLNDLGMNSEWVLSGRAAIERVKVRKEQGRDFHAVILDWKMPDQSGVRTIAEIRDILGEKVPIVIFSAFDWADIEQSAREAGATAFLAKPLFKTKLVNLFDSIINPGEEKKEEKSPLKKLEEMDFNGRSVLLAEDHRINAEIAKHIFHMVNLKVDWVEDGQEAFQRMKEVSDGYYAMIFMDIQMPKMNGYEAARAIRGIGTDYTKNVPIVAMTANAFADDVAEARKAGMNEHIAKPLDFEDLSRVLTTYIGQDDIGS